MAAAAFKASIQARNVRTGKTGSYYCTVSDVNGAYWLFPSGDSTVVLSPDPIQIYDIILSAAGTDTTNSSVFIGGVDSSIKIVHAANVYSVVTRQMQSNPIVIPAGVSLRITQNT